MATDIVMSNERAQAFLGQDPLETEDVIVSTTGAFFIMRELNARYFLGLAIAKPTNLEAARLVMRKYHPIILDLLGD